MQLTEHTDIGLRLLILLGATAPRRMSAQSLAQRHGLSYSYVQKVVQSLQASGFVETFKGRSGGVQLARLAADISVGEVVRALEPHLNFVECFRPGASSCLLVGGCELTQVMLRAKAAMLAELDKTTIADIVTGSSRVPVLLEEPPD
ncbi:MAG: Rrf2 family transcriptional regulator [Myxococcales bacterium]|nr:Rrf2 family transcriptional regulator [Myxococcales bacterium]